MAITATITATQKLEFIHFLLRILGTTQEIFRWVRGDDRQFRTSSRHRSRHRAGIRPKTRRRGPTQDPRSDRGSWAGGQKRKTSSRHRAGIRPKTRRGGLTQDPRSDRKSWAVNQKRGGQVVLENAVWCRAGAVHYSGGVVRTKNETNGEATAVSIFSDNYCLSLLKFQTSHSYKRSAKPVNALIKKDTHLELLPPDENAWKTLALEFLDRQDSVPAWNAHRAWMMPLFPSAKIKPGEAFQLTWDEPFTDALGNIQRVQISVLHFRWKTEEFRKVSSGFLGILAMIRAAETQGKVYVQPPPVQVRRDQPLQINSVMRKKIYDAVAPHIRFKPTEPTEIYQAPARMDGTQKGQSRQLKFRGDDGVWRTSVLEWPKNQTYDKIKLFLFLVFAFCGLQAYLIWSRLRFERRCFRSIMSGVQGHYCQISEVNFPQGFPLYRSQNQLYRSEAMSYGPTISWVVTSLQSHHWFGLKYGMGRPL